MIEHRDRRVVTLRAGDGIRNPAREFFGPLNERFEALVAGHSAELLDQVDGLPRELRAAMDALLTVAIPGHDGEVAGRACHVEVAH